jgi:LysR family hydrogen peroxide-inducible transcriptional activator
LSGRAAKPTLPVPCADSLKEMRLLLLEEGHCFRDQALSFCDIQTGRPREVLDASSLSTLVQMVNAGMGVTFIPEMAVPVETRSADVAISRFRHGLAQISRFEPPEPARTLGMVWRKSSPLAGQLTEIADLVRDAAQSKSTAN